MKKKRHVSILIGLLPLYLMFSAVCNGQNSTAMVSPQMIEKWKQLKEIKRQQEEIIREQYFFLDQISHQEADLDLLAILNHTIDTNECFANSGNTTSTSKGYSAGSISAVGLAFVFAFVAAVSAFKHNHMAYGNHARKVNAYSFLRPTLEGAGSVFFVTHVLLDDYETTQEYVLNAAPQVLGTARLLMPLFLLYYVFRRNSQR